MNLTLTFTALHEMGKVHQYFKKKLGFPSYYGMNLDALYDELSTCPKGLHIELKGTREEELELSGRGKQFIRMLKDLEADGRLTLSIDYQENLHSAD